MDKRIDWDQYFMTQALLLSLRSTCKRLSVGAIIVRDRRVIAGGYNGSVSGDVHCLDEGCYLVDGHCVRTIHAEMNAVLQCSKFGVATDGAEIYVTDFPCLQCTKMLLQTGIVKINYLRNYNNDPYAVALLKRKNVAVKQIKFTDEDLAKIDVKTLLKDGKQQFFNLGNGDDLFAGGICFYSFNSFFSIAICLVWPGLLVAAAFPSGTSCDVGIAFWVAFQSRESFYRATSEKL